MITFETTPLADMPALDWPSLARERGRAIDPALRDAFTASGPAAANLQRLFEGALCVTTGQQPGLFTGPLFTLYKGLSASALARTLEQTLRRPVVPVFWVAGDDHDFAEANHCFVLDTQGDLAEIELRRREPGAALTPLYRESLGPEIEPALERLRTALPESEFKTPILEWMARHYHRHADFSSAFAGALAELLGPHGVVVFQASHPAAKRVMIPWLQRALVEAGPLDRALAERGRQLATQGREVPVTVGDGATLVMVEASLGRDRLILGDGRYVTRRSGETWQPDDLILLFGQAPERFSPNVLLRPVVEAAILPTVTYIGGPGELAYLAQADPLYALLGVAPQGRVPRWSGRVLEPRVMRALEKHGVSAEVFIRQGSRLEAQLLREEIPAEARQALQALQKSIESEYATILAAATRIDPTLQRAVESNRNLALAGLGDVEKRLVGHLKKRNDIASSQLGRARVSLLPQGQPQERVVGTISFLARYGTPFIDEAATVVARTESLEPAHRRS